jgi:hypothetical protein
MLLNVKDAKYRGSKILSVFPLGLFIETEDEIDTIQINLRKMYQFIYHKFYVT